MLTFPIWKFGVEIGRSTLVAKPDICRLTAGIAVAGRIFLWCAERKVTSGSKASSSKSSSAFSSPVMFLPTLMFLEGPLLMLMASVDAELSGGPISWRNHLKIQKRFRERNDGHKQGRKNHDSRKLSIRVLYLKTTYIGQNNNCPIVSESFEKNKYAIHLQLNKFLFSTELVNTASPQPMNN